MEMAYKLPHNMFKVAFIFSLVFVGQGDILEWRCTNLQIEFITLRGELKVSRSLEEEIRIHGSPSYLAACVTELRDTLKDTKERCKVYSYSGEEKAHQVEEH